MPHRSATSRRPWASLRLGSITTSMARPSCCSTSCSTGSTSSIAKWRTFGPNRPRRAAAVTDVKAPSLTSPASTHGSRWKTGQRSGWAISTRCPRLAISVILSFSQCAFTSGCSASARATALMTMSLNETLYSSPISVNCVRISAARVASNSAVRKKVGTGPLDSARRRAIVFLI